MPTREAVLPARSMRLALLVALFAMVAALLPAAAQPAAAFPIESRCHTTTGNTGLEGFIDHDELGRTLAQIERASQGRVAVDVAGYTNHGLEIWTARVGHGDEVVLIQSEIHGNEKHGTTALLNLLRTLGNNSKRSQEIREAVTVVAVPKMNADGAEANQRQNRMTWDDVVRDFPQLDGASRAWNFNNRNQGFDVNRDFNPNLDYVPQPEDFPGNSASVGWYITPEAQTVRDVYADLEEEFGIVDVFVDLHGQGPCYVGDTMPDDYSPLSISGRFIADPAQHGDWPNFDFDASRRVNVAVYDALQVGNSPYGKITLYPQNINLPGTALGSFALRGSATILFETSGQTQHIGHKYGGMLTRQIEVGLTGILDAITDGTLGSIDPERYDDIPLRRNTPVNN